MPFLTVKICYGFERYATINEKIKEINPNFIDIILSKVILKNS